MNHCDASHHSAVEHEWRTCVAVIQAAAEILRDNRRMQRGERQQFLDAIIDGNGRLTRSFERLASR
ncbi:MAG: hypothetical protein JNM48_12865 [Rhodospirillales bacterium]|nr:hypothetical protein [Rhodospirillales bacterium]